MSKQNNINIKALLNCNDVKPVEEKPIEYLRKDNLYLKNFIDNTLNIYKDCKMFGMSVGHVNSKEEFNYCAGTRSVVVDPSGNSNIDPLTNTMKDPRDAFGTVITDKSLKPFTEKSYCSSASIGKIIYSCALMALVDRGVINLGDPVIKFFPEWQYMKVLKQKFFYDVSKNAVYGQRENEAAYKIVDGSLNELVVIKLSDGLTDTIANFITKGRVQKVDYSILPEPYKTYATNKVVYYVEVIPIDLNINKTYGTVAMAFSHQLGLGLNTPLNKLITPALYDRGVYSPNYTTNGAKSSSTLSTLYPNGYSHTIWLKEVLKAGLLSTMPGAVLEYDTSISIGIACCEVAYKQFYNLSTIKPFWQIINELVINPMNLQNDILFKTPTDPVARQNIIDSFTAQYTMNTAGDGIRFNSLASYENLFWKIHDLGSINFAILNIYGMKELAFMLANYGVDRKGTRILSKNSVISMCEKNYLHPNIDIYFADESQNDGNYGRTNLTIFGNSENISFGIGGQIFKARDGKVLNCNGENYPEGWYSWSGAVGHVLYVNPSEGKYFVATHKHGSSLTPVNTANPNNIYTRTDASGNIIPAGANVPARYNSYGLDQALSLYLN